MGSNSPLISPAEVAGQLLPREKRLEKVQALRPLAGEGGSPRERAKTDEGVA